MRAHAVVDRYFVLHSVRFYLQKRGLDQQKLAKLIGISPPHLCDVLYGRRNPTRFIPLIAKVLKVRVEEISVPASAGQPPPREEVHYG